MTTVAIERLGPESRPMLLAHFLSLPSTDRRLRFGTPVAAQIIARYVDRIDFARDAIFGVHGDDFRLAGVVHVAFDAERAELGLSVLPAQRRRGVGRALFERAAEHARNRWISVLQMQYLSTNAAIMSLAHRLGMEIAFAGAETEARLWLPVPSIASIAREWVTDGVAYFEGALKAFLAGWRHKRNRAGTPR
jgi:GNAT superfamily N-acetyltransferase